MAHTQEYDPDDIDWLNDVLRNLREVAQYPDSVEFVERGDGEQSMKLVYELKNQ